MNVGDVIAAESDGVVWGDPPTDLLCGMPERVVGLFRRGASALVLAVRLFGEANDPRAGWVEIATEDCCGWVLTHRGRRYAVQQTSAATSK